MALVFLTSNQTSLTGYAYGLAASENTSIVINQGVIIGGATGIQLSTPSNITVKITNYGNIYGQGSAIYAETALANHLVYNYGVISGGNYSLNFFSGADAIYNQGELFGAVSLFGGNDLFDSRDGYVYGGIYGGAGEDTLIGGRSVDSLYGGDDNDLIYCSIEDAVINGGAGRDTVFNTYDAFGITFDMGANSIESYIGSNAGETILTSTNGSMSVNARGGNDLIRGSEVLDALSAGEGDDLIFGNGGDDTIIGGLGNDTIEGGSGSDQMRGNEGSDYYVFRGVDGANIDYIDEFFIGEDKIQILRSGFLSPDQWGPGALDPARFVASANPSPIIGKACFLFDNDGYYSGALYWNDGSGAAQGLCYILANNDKYFSAADFVLV